MPSSPSSRLAYIDWMRGLACVLMFQTHCYDAWLSSDARKSTFFMWSQLGGTLPAPLFLFLAGISFGLVVDKRFFAANPVQVNRDHETGWRDALEPVGIAPTAKHATSESSLSASETAQPVRFRGKGSSSPAGLY